MCFAIPVCAYNGDSAAYDAGFVGRVIDVWPSRQQLNHELSHFNEKQLRRVASRRWRELLTEEERARMRSLDKSSLQATFALWQRVRFAVQEVLYGPTIREIYTDASSCGYRFQRGVTYLVLASKTDGRYGTGACSRTGRVTSRTVEEDLKTLRARRDRVSLPPRIYGSVDRNDFRPDTKVSLIDNAGANRQAQFNGAGWFAFDDLNPAMYRLRVEDSRGIQEKKVDLSHRSCFEATLYFGKRWEILGEIFAFRQPAVVYVEPPPLASILP